MNDRFKTLRAQVLVATWLSYAGLYITRKVFSVLKAPIRDALVLDDFGVSTLFTTYLVTYAAGQFLTAWLSTRIRLRTQLLVGMTTSMLCNVAAGALLQQGPSAYAPLLVVMGIHGFAQATGWPCNLAIMSNWTRHPERGRIFGLWGTCYQLGAGLSKVFASKVFGLAGLTGAYWASSLVLLVFIVVFWFWGREHPEPPLVEDAPVVVKAQQSGAVRDPMTLVAAMGVMYFGFKFLRYVVDSWSALIAADVFHLSTENAGYVSTAFDWIGFLGVIIAGWWSDRIDSRIKVALWMSVGLTFACLAMWLTGSSSLLIFVILLGLIGFLEMGPDSMISGVGAVETGDRKSAARAAGIINGCGSLGPILQEPVIGWLKRDHGADAVWLLLLGVTIASTIAVAIFYVVLSRRNIRL